RRLVIESCSRASIINALQRMVILGLDPVKKQCYFIAYGSSLVCQPSYFGDMAIARRVRPGIEIHAQPVYEGDELSWDVVNGKISGVRHIQSLDNMDDSAIKAAYCVVTDKDGKVVDSEVMT